MSVEFKIAEDIPEQNQTAYAKGRELEIEFSKFMKENLGWEKVRVGVHLSGKLNRKGAAVDIIGEALDARGKTFHKFGIAWIVGSVICALLSCFCIYAGIGTGMFFLFMSCGALVGALVFMYNSDKYNKENVLVECKNHKGKVNINQVDKSIREMKDYLASGDTEYKFTRHYFVSANGFVENALKYAKEHGIFCFDKKGDTFSEVVYWD